MDADRTNIADHPVGDRDTGYERGEIHKSLGPPDGHLIFLLWIQIGWSWVHAATVDFTVEDS